jgi:nucleoside 2-deoxyribosyltransferase
MKTKRIYIAGPMRGRKHYNAEAFDAAEAELRSVGFDVLNPVFVDRTFSFDHYTMTATPQQVLEFQAAALKALRGCDGIALLAGWNTSQGVADELAVAQKFEIPYMPLAAWVAQGRQALRLNKNLPS